MKDWISVKKRLPKNGQRILVVQDPILTNTKDALFSIFDEDKNRFRAIDGIFDYRIISYWVDITHWMPLPEPPKE